MFYFFFYYPLCLDVRSSRPVWMTWALITLAVLGFGAIALALPSVTEPRERGFRCETVIVTTWSGCSRPRPTMSCKSPCSEDEEVNSAATIVEPASVARPFHRTDNFRWS